MRLNPNVPFNIPKPLRSGWLRIASVMVCWWAMSCISPLWGGDTKEYFDIPAGPAEDSLTEFALQASELLVFDARNARGVPTPAVRGWHTVQEALDLMLAGTDLTAMRDPVNAVVTIRSRQIETVIKLPPYVVDDVGIQVQPWMFGSLPGLEVLSRCSVEETRIFVNRHQRLMAMLATLLPPALQPSQDVPLLLVIDRRQLQSKATRELIDTIQRRLKGNPVTNSLSFMPNFHFWDQDSQVIYFLIEEYESDKSSVTLTPAYLRFLLETRTPSLPRWFIEGMVRLQEMVVLPVPAFSADRPNTTTFFYQKPAYPYDSVTVLPFVWVTPERTKAMLQTAKDMAREKQQGRVNLLGSFGFLPLEQLLKPATFESVRFGDDNLPAFQAALLIRWLLDPSSRELTLEESIMGVGKPAPEALWSFIDRSSREPVTAALFEECFGLTYREVNQRLRDYLPYASLNSAEFKLEQAVNPTVQDPELRLANADEVARLKGRQDRLSMGYVRNFYPELFQEYAAQARRTLNRAHGLDGETPMLLAEMGLCEVDAGDDAAAAPLLAAAIQKNIVHPRVYYELARIQFERFRSEHTGLSQGDPEVDGICNLLLTGLKQAPALPKAYELLFELWLRQERRLTPDELKIVSRGAELFPVQYRVVYAAALLQIGQGHHAAAQNLLARSLTVISNRLAVERLEQLLAQLKTGPST